MRQPGQPPAHGVTDHVAESTQLVKTFPDIRVWNRRYKVEYDVLRIGYHDISDADRAAKADVASLTAFEAGLFGWMALMFFVLFPASHHLMPDSPAYWLGDLRADH